LFYFCLSSQLGTTLLFIADLTSESFFIQAGTWEFVHGNIKYFWKSGRGSFIRVAALITIHTVVVWQLVVVFSLHFIHFPVKEK
ncbi:MAG: hypothetical protein ACH254_22635, partial [Candidatus Thiodiazotropha endolucinida]